MAKRIELDGLTPQEAEAAKLRATGLSQAEAYRRAFKVQRMKPKKVYEKASTLFGRPAVKGRVRELLKAAKVQDLISVGEWLELVRDGVEKAKADNNMTAFFNGTRQLGQALGALKDNVNLTVEQQMSDAELIERLAMDDPAKVAALQQILGAADKFDA